MNPCPCGQLGTADRACTCPPGVPERYLRRVSGPLRDRIDLWVAVDRVPPATLIGPVAARVVRAGRRAHRGRAAAAARSRPARRRTGASGDARSGRSVASTTSPAARAIAARGARGAVRSRHRAAAARRADDRGPRGLGGRRDRAPRRGRPVPGAGGPADDAGGGLMLGVGRAGAWRRDEPATGGAPSVARRTGRRRRPAGDRRPIGAGAADADDRERDAWVVLDARPGRRARVVRAADRGLRRRAQRPREALCAAWPGPARRRLRRARRRLAVALVGDREGRRGRSGRIRDRQLAPLDRAGVRARHAGRRRLPVAAATDRAAAARALRLRIGAARSTARRSVAIVGTRRPTAVGRATAARIADAVAGLDATVVSGLALGIDAAAHAATAPRRRADRRRHRRRPRAAVPGRPPRARPRRSWPRAAR